MRTLSREARRLRDWIALALILAACLLGTAGSIRWIDEGPTKPDSPTLTILLATLLLLYLAFYASSYPRPILLYLRKFGEKSDDSPFAQAAKQQVFRDYRIVTLNDESSNPRISDGSAYFVIALVMIALWGIAMDRASDSVSAWLGFLFIAIPFAAKLMSMLLEAKWAKTHSLAIRCSQDLTVVAEKVGRWRDRGNWLIIRRVSNIAVAESQWKETVSKLALDAQLVVIDVSKLAPGVAWEVDLALHRFPEKTIFLAQERSVAEANIAEAAEEALKSVSPNLVTIGNEPAEARRSIKELRRLLRSTEGCAEPRPSSGRLLQF